MKKVLTVLMALTMVVGFAAMASAQTAEEICFNCNGTAGNINRGCDTAQTPSCAPFDFENNLDYCLSKTPNRALFKICDCIDTGAFETVVTDDVIEVTMEILVDKGAGKVSGDNGVYWAEDMNDGPGVALGLFETQADACAATYAYGTYFSGAYEYLTAAGTVGTPTMDQSCTIENSNRVVKFQPVRGQALGTFGYVVQPEDELFGTATWAIDIPMMRVDNSLINGGEKVWVKICLLRDCSGICSNDEICCCEIYIGELCCNSDTITRGTLLYPYFPKADSTYYDINAFTVSNLDIVAGGMTVTLYEADGDVGTVTYTAAADLVPAHGIYLRTLGALVDEMTVSGTGSGVLGDAACYIMVAPEFTADGFGFIANSTSGASMGYLPRH